MLVGLRRMVLRLMDGVVGIGELEVYFEEHCRACELSEALLEKSKKEHEPFAVCARSRSLGPKVRMTGLFSLLDVLNMCATSNIEAS